MPGIIANLPRFQFSANGVPMVGGTLTAYVAGTTTPANTWQDMALSIANTNPITLDARGECVLWLDEAVIYKFVLKNAQGVIQWTQDNITNSSMPLRAELASTGGAGIVGRLPSGAGGVAQTVASALAKNTWLGDHTTPAQSIAAVPSGLLRVPRGVYNVSNLQLTGESLEGDGPGSVLMASGAGPVLLLGLLAVPSLWSRRRIANLTINGKNKTSDGLFFSNVGSTELSGRWTVSDVSITSAVRGIHKPNGNIGNRFQNISLSECEYGYYAVGQNTPVMHAGADIIDGGEINSCSRAAIYISSPQSGTGGTQIRGTIIEGNPGFGVFVKSFALSFTPLLLDGVWFETNATAAVATVDGAPYTPRDIYLENCAYAVIENGILPKIQLVNSAVTARSVFMYSGSIYTLDANSAITVDQANIDSGMHPVMVNTIAKSQRANGSGAATWWAPVRQLQAGILAEKLQSLPFDGPGPYLFNGSVGVDAFAVADGRLFPSCAELAVPGGATLVQPAVTMVANKWCVLTTDIKHISGTLGNLTFSCVSGQSLVGFPTALIKTGKWATLACIAKVATPGTAGMYLNNAGTGPITVRLSAWQIVQFDTEQEAYDYYNSRAFYK